MNQYGIAVLGLMGIIAMVGAVLAFAALKLVVGARHSRRRQNAGGDATLLSAALQDAMTLLQEQERAMSARAVASEQLSSQIVDG